MLFFTKKLEENPVNLQVYSNSTYSRLVWWHIIFPVVLLSVLSFLYPGMLFTYFTWIVLFFALLGIGIVFMQNKNFRFGYLVFINLTFDIWFLLMVSILIGEATYTSFDPEFLILHGVLVIFLLISMFVHIFIASSLFSLTSRRKLKTAFFVTLLIVVLIVFKKITHITHFIKHLPSNIIRYYQ
ncbi:MAG: hypothetical protein AAB693_00865 [Patescibacteria group bacterium]